MNFFIKRIAVLEPYFLMSSSLMKHVLNTEPTSWFIL